MRVHRTEKDSIGVYVHIPYCVSKCPYCDFRSVTGGVREGEYAERLLEELSFFVKKEGLGNRFIESIYIGGGTPSIFSPAEIARLVSCIKKAFAHESPEVTLEANPDTVTPEKLSGYIKGGVTRLSIGVQSFDDRVLKNIGRPHSARRAQEALIEARAAGFKNIGADLIFGLPGQTMEVWRDSLERLIDIAPEHVSIYGLTIEEGTPFHGIYGGKRDGLPSEGEETGMYGMAVELLAKGGWSHYEISNFSRPGYSSAHNSRYWSGLDYLGLGASSHSYLSSPGWGRRWWNEDSPDKYMKMVREMGEAVLGSEELTKEEAMRESLMLGLRMLFAGVRGEAFKERYGAYPKEVFGNSAGLEKDGLLRASGNDLFLTPDGVLFSNEVFLRF